MNDKSARANPTELYRSYKGWAEANHEYVWSQKQFSQKLEERRYKLKKSHGERYVAGLRLRSPTTGGRKFVGGGVVPITSTNRPGVARGVGPN